mmetsp:Transcript_821/g.2132  ORF Transcript_821/g.2132 Transcript_821/m.2132 type:complete len:291 (+) Transcript_821:56-928(+)
MRGQGAVLMVACVAARTGEAAMSQENLRQGLDRMEERSKNLADFLVAAKGSKDGLLEDETPQVYKDYEIVTCPAVGAAFVHVYKAAGTTGMELVKNNCPGRWYKFNRHGCPERDDQPVCFSKAQDTDWAANITTAFTFVRDPVERFQSGIFELAKHHGAWISQLIDVANTTGRAVADVVIDDLIRTSRRDGSLPNAHLMPQTYFLHDKAEPLPKLKYIATVGPHFDEDLQILGLELFGDQIGVHHANAAANAVGQAKGEVYIHDEVISQETRFKIFRYYEVDYAWLGGFH